MEWTIDFLYMTGWRLMRGRELIATFGGRYNDAKRALMFAKKHGYYDANHATSKI